MVMHLSYFNNENYAICKYNQGVVFLLGVMTKLTEQCTTWVSLSNHLLQRAFKL